MNSAKNSSFEIAAKKVFLQLGQFIEEDEKLNNNHVLFHKFPNDIIHKISNNLLDKMTEDSIIYLMIVRTINY
jgi:hypothetical protein